MQLTTLGKLDLLLHSIATAWDIRRLIQRRAEWSREIQGIHIICIKCNLLGDNHGQNYIITNVTNYTFKKNSLYPHSRPLLLGQILTSVHVAHFACFPISLYLRLLS